MHPRRRPPVPGRRDGNVPASHRSAGPTAPSDLPAARPVPSGVDAAPATGSEGALASAPGVETSVEITRKSASNLALAFVLLPKEKRDAMSALYAFCREVDDVADEESVPTEERARQLEAWRVDIRKACDGGRPEFAVNRELQPVIERFKLPFSLFHELLLGVEMDLVTTRYPDYAALDLYCYRVASVVGLLSIEIFGYQDPRCREYAIALGKALQYTNILRDIGNDATRDRIYVPSEEMKRCGVTPEEIFGRRHSERMEALAASVAARARGFYAEARRLLPPAEKDSMIAAELMGSVYWSLLRRIERRHYPVLDEKPLRLGKIRKLLLVLLAWARIKLSLPLARYGV